MYFPLFLASPEDPLEEELEPLFELELELGEDEEEEEEDRTRVMQLIKRSNTSSVRKLKFVLKYIKDPNCMNLIKTREV